MGQETTESTDKRRPVVVEPVGLSRVGVYVVRGHYSEQEARAIFAQLRDRLGHGDVVLVLEPDQSLAPLSDEEAITLHRHLGERLACITPATSREG